MPRSDSENTIDRAVQLGRDNQHLISLIEAHCTDARVVHPHGLRHTCPAELALEAVPVPLIQQPAHNHGLPAPHRARRAGREHASGEL